MKLAVEFVEAIAAHYRSVHGDHIHYADATKFDFSPYDGLDWLHASPPCTRASVANSKGGESEVDWDLAKATVEAVRAIYPKVFTLENVWGYRNFKAFEWICDALTFLDYTWDVAHVNAADFGVPQIRKRLILRAWRKHKKPIPPIVTTHADPKKNTGLLPWVGWYAATADLLPHCPETNLAPWQEKRLKAKYGDNFLESLLIRVNGQDGDVGIPACGQAPALTADGAGKLRAVLLGSQGWEGDVQRVPGDEPGFPPSTTSGCGTLRAVLDGEPYRVVEFTPACLARVMSLPDSYALPAKKGLAVKIIGNGVPPLMMRKIVLPLLEELS